MLTRTWESNEIIFQSNARGDDVFPPFMYYTLIATRSRCFLIFENIPLSLLLILARLCEFQPDFVAGLSTTPVNGLGSKTLNFPKEEDS